MVCIRRAKFEDATFFAAIDKSAAQLFKEVPDVAWIASDAALPLETYVGFIKNEIVWVAEKNGQVIAFLLAKHYEKVIHLCELAVDLNYQRQGIGSKLIQQVEDYARNHHRSALTLTTFNHVAWNAPYYKKFGFTEMTEAQLKPWLKEILAQEVASGCDAQRRCAMIKKL